MPAFKTLDDLDAKGKRVVVRVDLNVPIENGEVRDATRIERIVPTLRELLDKGAAVILLAHFDRPKGKVVPEMSLKPVAPALEKALGRPVEFRLHRLARRQGRSPPRRRPNPVSASSWRTRAFMPARRRTIAVPLRIVREPGRCLVNDAFSAAHRAHSSTEGIAASDSGLCRPRHGGRTQGA